MVNFLFQLISIQCIFTKKIYCELYFQRYFEAQTEAIDRSIVERCKRRNLEGNLISELNVIAEAFLFFYNGGATMETVIFP